MEPEARNGRDWRKPILVAGVFATVQACTGMAAASDGGGVGTPDPPTLTGVVCVEACADVRAAAVGSRVQLNGRNLDGVDEVKFAAEGAGRVAAKPSSVGATAVEVKVPKGAETGTVIASAYGIAAETPRDEPLEIVPKERIDDPGPFKLTSAAAVPRSTFFDGPNPPRVVYMFRGRGATDIRIEVVNRETHEVVTTMIDRNAEPGTRNAATWNRRTSSGGPAPGADYVFRIGAAAGGGTTATEDARFSYHLWRFPLASNHTYGDGYGAGRDHQGQDVFARCGTPIHAVRGGRVQVVDLHSAAGNYVVVDSKGTEVDAVYEHMARRSPLREGARVRTGQVVGNVGQTGNASECHLHFELWSAAGWYEGGHAMASVGRLLRLWDTWS